MLADSLLPIPFWVEAVNTGCYVQNQVLVTKPHNKTPYELLLGRTPSIGFMRPFGCPVTILNTLDPLGTGPTWLFDIDSLTRTMNYQPVTLGTQTNSSAGFQDKFDAKKARNEVDPQYVLFPVWSSGSLNPQNNDEDAAFNGIEHDFDVKRPESEVNLSSSSSAQSKKQDDKTKKEAKGKSLVESVTRYRNLNAEFKDCSENNSNKANAAGSIVPTVGQNSLNSTNTFSDVGPSNTEEPKRVHQSLKDPNWIEAMQEELLQFKMHKVWVLVELPHGKRAISTKWVYRNKKDERGILIRNKVRLVAQGHTQEEGIDYKEVFSPVARIEDIRLFLAYASFMGFMVYQMDAKSAFLYGTIEEEVYVCQPLGFEDPDHPDKVYKVVKALYGLHQAPRAWYETLATYLLENGFQRADERQVLDEFYGGTHFFLGLQCKKQAVVATSSTKAEYVFWNTVVIKQTNDVTRLQALVDKKKVVVTDSAIREVLWLDDAEGVDCLPNEEIFAELARMGYEKPSTKLTFYKAFFSSQVKKLEKGNRVKVLKLRRLKKVGTSQRIDTSKETVMDDASNQERMIDEMDKDDAVALMDDKEKEKKEEEAKVVEDDQVQGRQAEIYKIDMDRALKVLSMQEDEPAEVQEVVDVVTTAKLITEVVTTASETITTASTIIFAAEPQVPTATIIAALVRVVATSTRRRKGVVIRDPEEESSTVIPADTKSKDKGKGIIDVAIDHVKQKAKEDPAMQRYQVMKKRPQTEAQARKNMIMYLKNVDGFRLDYFKGMSYDDICLLFKAKFNSNTEFLLKTKEQMQEEESRAIQSINETPAQKAAKRRKLNEEVEDLKRHLEIMPDEDDDFYTEATPLARKVPVMDYELIHLNNKPHYKIIRADRTHQLYVSFLTLLKNYDIEDLESLWSLVKERFSTSKPNNFCDDFSLTTLGAMFERPDGQAQVWKNQRTVHGQAKVKSSKLLESYGVHIITFTTTQLILLVERRYPLSRFTLDQMLNAVRLRVEEESEMSLELLSAAKQKLMLSDSAAEGRINAAESS
nr:retrovirus-related Pol polyprotein from transposon TNT 1-94 [Tanacetum cinerariifolium]